MDPKKNNSPTSSSTISDNKIVEKSQHQCFFDVDFPNNSVAPLCFFDDFFYFAKASENHNGISEGIQIWRAKKIQGY